MSRSSLTSPAARGDLEPVHAFDFPAIQIAEGHAEMRAGTAVENPADSPGHGDADPRARRLAFEEERPAEFLPRSKYQGGVGQDAAHPALAQVDERGGDGGLTAPDVPAAVDPHPDLVPSFRSATLRHRRVPERGDGRRGADRCLGCPDTAQAAD